MKGKILFYLPFFGVRNMQWLEGIWNNLSDIFKSKPEQEITWHAMDTPEWIKPEFQDEFKTDGVKTLVKEEISPFIFLGLLFLVLYFLTK